MAGFYERNRYGLRLGTAGNFCWASLWEGQNRLVQTGLPVVIVPGLLTEQTVPGSPLVADGPMHEPKARNGLATALGSEDCIAECHPQDVCLGLH